MFLSTLAFSLTYALVKQLSHLPTMEVAFFRCAIAFGGVLLIERFDPRISILYLLTGVSAAFCSGVAYNLVRSLREREHPLTIVLHFQIFGAVVCFFAMWFDWVTPVGWDWFYLLLIGVFSQIGQVFLTHALQKEKAAGVVIINYSGVVYGLMIGWFFFSEAQTFESLSGMLLVVFGVALSVFYGKRQRELEKLEATIS